MTDGAVRAARPSVPAGLAIAQDPDFNIEDIDEEEVTTTNSTEVRKGRALAEFQRMEEITPRTAILEFAAAHKSTMKTTSRYFSALQSDVNTTDGRKGHALAEFQHNSTMETPARRLPGIEESPSSPSPLLHGRRSRSSGPRVREEEMNPDRDITRPTVMSGPNTSQYSASDGSIGSETVKRPTDFNSSLESPIRQVIPLQLLYIVLTGNSHCRPAGRVQAGAGRRAGE